MAGRCGRSRFTEYPSEEILFTTLILVEFLGGEPYVLSGLLNKEPWGFMACGGYG